MTKLRWRVARAKIRAKIEAETKDRVPGGKREVRKTKEARKESECKWM